MEIFQILYDDCMEITINLLYSYTERQMSCFWSLILGPYKINIRIHNWIRNMI